MNGALHDKSFTVRALLASDAAAFRALRLEALATAPEAFSSSYEEESALTPEAMAARISHGGPNAIFGAFAGDHLVGMAGFFANERLKQRHKGALAGIGETFHDSELLALQLR